MATPDATGTFRQGTDNFPNHKTLMSCYFIAHISIYDNDEYQKYLDKAGAIFSKYRGEYLAVDNATEVLEGSREYDRTVLIRFDTIRDFDEWYRSEEYQEILKHRLKAARCDTVLVKGLD
ncbi:DUF1330 domain-containing protein [Balneolales bacterium ANBcel1]|nr:DUF1330 domain-containing protein [Balneolales bacterium ANBcel1]